MVRGLPAAANAIIHSNKNVESLNHLPAEALNAAIQRSNLVISRSGYTTVMDLVKLAQKAVLVATPGQYEQEYLATYLMEKKLFCCVPQKNLSLRAIEKEAAVFPFVQAVFEEKYKEVIQNYLQQL